MSKGSQRITVRLSPVLIERSESQMERLRARQFRPQDYGWSDFIREAVREYLGKFERGKEASRKRMKNSKTPDVQATVGECTPSTERDAITT